jgi:hypothetical protein
MQKTTYAIFLFSGTILPESTMRVVKTRDIPDNIPEGCFAFYFVDIDEKGKESNRSNRFYVGGSIYTLEEVKANFPELHILISNMEINDWKRVVKTPLGNWQPLFEGDTVLS